MNKSVHLISLGCPKNLVDSEIMLGSLLKDGYSITQEEAEADTIIVNTCSFIDESKEESISRILEAAEHKTTGKLRKLVVTGCLPQRYKEELVKEMPEVDIFVGSGEFQKIAEILRESNGEDFKKDHFHLPTYLQEENTPRVNSEPFYRAYIKIAEGCLKRCSFCAIPKIRGNLQSRRIPGIINEAKLLVAGGVREVNIISHDFTDYGWDIRKKDPTAVESPYELLKALSDVKGLDWIRLLYLYPDGLDEKVLKLIKERDNLVKYFDMPLQHINTKMLKQMNRKMTREEVEATVYRIREFIPDAVIRTQFIVGFPGEGEEEFEELVEFVKKHEFDRVGCFKYSPQEGTAGGKMDGQIDEDIKEKRFHTLMKAQNKISKKLHKKFIGKTMKVIIDGVSEETDLLLQGRTSLQAPGIDGVVLISEGKAKPGDIVDVLITDSHDYDLVGRII
ncbi:MAG: 30S ribosomal protein S12 methylthiotransferase RimO [Bdellovibrionaceae bacterium]|nr:30S ribosomal protein S12 methylthiotransferase RimO [Pseudobdellovibrionaceae bacterium]